MVEALLEQAAWLTPTSLFLLLNVVIATILVSSSFHKKPLHGGTTGGGDSSSAPPSFNPPQQPLTRAPSLFSRVASFNFSANYDSSDQQQYHHHSWPSFFSRVTSFNFSGRADEPDSDESLTREKNQDPEPEPQPKQDVSEMSQSHVTSKTEARTVVRAASLLSRVASFTIGVRAPAVEVDGGNGKKSESGENGGGKKVGNEQEQGRGKAVKKSVKKKKVVKNGTTTFSRAEEEVDTKADDFINRFKQQLKLQRLDSLLRCRST